MSVLSRVLLGLAILWGPVLVLGLISLVAYWLQPKGVEDPGWQTSQTALRRVNPWPPTDDEALPRPRRLPVERSA